MNGRRWLGLCVSLACLVLLVPPAALGDNDQPVQRTFQIDLSVRETMKTQDWSGRATISKGRIVAVEKTSGPVDSIHPDGSWTIVYGRSLKGRPKQQPAAKALAITVEAPPDAVLSLETQGGDFSFRVDEIPQAKKIKALDGNVAISIGRRRTGRKRSRQKQLPPATIAGELPSEPITDGRRQSEWPSLAVSPGGTEWCAFVEWNGQDRDRVRVVRRRPGGTWQEPVSLDDGLGDHYWPAIGLVGETAVVVWSARQEANFDLYWCTISPDGKPGDVARLTKTPHTDFHARMAGDGRENLVLVWQSFAAGQSDVYAARFAAGTWQSPVRVSPSEANDWQPEVALDAQGSAWICWDSYHHGNYDVFLRRFDANGLGPVIPITSEPTAQFHSTVAVDRQGRVWVAWDNGGLNWGKDLSTSSAAEGYQGLHYARQIGLRVYADGSVYDPQYHPRSAMTGRMTRYAELPQLATDPAGTLWLVFRHWTITRPTEMFHVYATRLTDQGWTTPWRLAGSSGRNSQWASLSPDAKGNLRVAYASDGRSPENLPRDQIHSLVYQVRVATLPGGSGLPPVELTKSPRAEPATKFVKRVRPTMRVGRKTYTLMLGDCHRHTDIRGHSGVDASILDTFRYALDAAQLDYMGLGDHNEVFGGRWPDGLRDYQWWWTQKAVDLFTCPPVFVGLFSYEHSMSSPAGHRNLIFLKRGAPLRRIDRGAKLDPNPANMPPALWTWVRQEVLTQPGQRCVIVPHTFAAGPLADWDWPNAKFDCLLEIYQGCRGSYEKWNLPPGEKRGGTQTRKRGHFAQDALDRGNVYGFVSFSDHRSTHNSWGCVWVEEISREAVLDAMLARRTYAATDEITIKITADDRHTMGEMFQAAVASPPSLKIEIEAPDEIRRVDVIKNGLHVWTKAPRAKTLKTTFRDFSVSPGKAYYYVRVFQRDPEAPDGDPEMAWSSPMFVTYK